jgi:Zn-dependent membrane protease YugP
MTLAIIVIVIAMIIGLWAQLRIGSAYNRWKRVGSRSGLTGREAAAYVLRAAGIHDVEISATRGHLTDHYDPTRKRLVLSEENYHGRSLAAVGVAAHEAGHAVQHATNYSMLKLRMGLVPMTQFASQMLPLIFFGGFFFGLLPQVAMFAAVIYGILTVFQLVTLPVEFNASRRAKKQLVGLGILQQDEMVGVNQTLNAAAWTYVAAFVSSLGWLLYFLAAANGRRD